MTKDRVSPNYLIRHKTLIILEVLAHNASNTSGQSWRVPYEHDQKTFVNTVTNCRSNRSGTLWSMVLDSGGDVTVFPIEFIPYLIEIEPSTEGTCLLLRLDYHFKIRRRLPYSYAESFTRIHPLSLFFYSSIRTTSSFFILSQAVTS